MPRIPARLEAVASLVIEGHAVADIGADHALLGVYLVRTGLAPYVVAGERAFGPLDRARHTVDIWHETKRIDVRRGDGLNALEPGDAIGTVVVAGMGGRNIADILSVEHLNRLPSIRRVVAQPNRDSEALADHLSVLGWRATGTRRSGQVRWPWRVMAFDRAL